MHAERPLGAVGAQSEKAEEIFQSMLSKRCKPNVATYSALLLAHIQADQWRAALQASCASSFLLDPSKCAGVIPVSHRAVLTVRTSIRLGQQLQLQLWPSVVQCVLAAGKSLWQRRSTGVDNSVDCCRRGTRCKPPTILRSRPCTPA